MLHHSLLAALVLLVAAPAAAAPIQVRYQITGGSFARSDASLGSRQVGIATGEITASFYQRVTTFSYSFSRFYATLEFTTTQAKPYLWHLRCGDPTSFNYTPGSCAYHVGPAGSASARWRRSGSTWSTSWRLLESAGGAMNLTHRRRDLFTNSERATLTLVGQEILVPEPGAGALLAGGALAASGTLVGGAAAAARRRRRLREQRR